MGGKGGGKSITTQQSTAPQIPPELAPWVNAAVANILQAMPTMPMSAFTAPNPQRIPNLSPTQMSLLNQQAQLPGQMAEAMGAGPNTTPMMPTFPTWQSQAPPMFPPGFGQPRQPGKMSPWQGGPPMPPPEAPPKPPPWDPQWTTQA